jgi:hypothetical protein
MSHCCSPFGTHRRERALIWAKQKGSFPRAATQEIRSLRWKFVFTAALGAVLGCGSGDSSAGAGVSDSGTEDNGGTVGGDGSTTGDDGATTASGGCSDGDFKKCDCLDGSVGFANCNAATGNFGPCTCGRGVEIEGLDPDTYVANLEKEGTEGHFVVKLVISVPIPKDLEFYNWTVAVFDQAGVAVDGAAVEAEPRMPQHDHGTFPPITPGAPTGNPGEYELIDMDLFMPGIWQVTIRIKKGGLSDEVAYNFDLDG